MVKKSESTNESSANGISQKIEAAVIGLVGFLAKYLKTHWFIFRHPASFGRHVIAREKPFEGYVAPYTYLTFGGFVFTISITAIPYGAWEAFNEGIWAFEGVVGELQQRWKEALSVSTLLLAAFPVLLTVSFLSSIYARTMYPHKFRQAIIDLSAYAFGFASFFYFFFYIVSAFSFLVEYFGIDTSKFEESTAFVWVTLGAMLTVPLISLMCPLLLLVQANRSLERVSVSKFAFRVWISPLYVILVFLACSFTASVPGAFSALERSKLPSKDVIATFVGTPFLNLPKNWRTSNDGVLTYAVLIENRAEKLYVSEISSMRTVLKFSKENTEISIRHPEADSATEGVQKLAIVKPGTADLLKFSVPVRFTEDFRNGLLQMSELMDSDRKTSPPPDFSKPYSQLVLYVDPLQFGNSIRAEGQVLLSVGE